LLLPAAGTALAGPAAVTGRVDDANLDNWELSLAPLGSDLFVRLAGGTAGFAAGTIVTLDPSRAPDGPYVLRLTARDIAGRVTTVDRVVSFATGVKSGEYSVSVVDLTVTLDGVSFELRRDYHSFEFAAGLAGAGWLFRGLEAFVRVDVTATGLESRGFFTAYRAGTRLDVRLPDGTSAAFAFAPTAVGGTAWRPAWTALTAGGWTLTSAPALLTATAGGYVQTGTGLAYNPADTATFGPDAFTLTSPDGALHYTYGADGHLRAITTEAGGHITVTDAGLIAADGTRLGFQTDAAGRLSVVTAPNGTQILYQYDSGLLSSVVNLQSGARTHYG
jgi:hypothetical protein